MVNIWAYNYNRHDQIMLIALLSLTQTKIACDFRHSSSKWANYRVSEDTLLFAVSRGHVTHGVR